MQILRPFSATLAVMLVLPTPAIAVQQDAKPQAVSPDQIHNFNPQTVPLGPIDAEGPILDIGGGQGIIGHVMGSQVVTIDVSEEKLSKRETEAKKIVMDARDLKFDDGSFSTATAFFSLLRFDAPDQAKVFGEVYRVLAPGGRFLVWDAVLGPRPEGKQIAVIPVAVKVAGENIDAGYSRRWPDEVHDLDHYRKLAEAAGFIVADQDHKAEWFRFELQKAGDTQAEPDPAE
jgi:ubiquinone/menaquinone biosynthesis C-methylase UbiE